ncbi:MAG: hypothetical protein WBL93_12825 [Lutisporaceae bacterium]
MEIKLINIVRDLYWDDRESLDMEILAASLIFYRHNVNLINYKYSEIFDNSETIIKDIAKEANAIFVNFDFSTDEDTMNLIYEIVDSIKKHEENIAIFMVGERACLNYSDILRDCPSIDYVMLCEAEKAGREITEILKDRHNINNCLDFAFREVGEIKKAPQRQDFVTSYPWALRDKDILESLQVAKVRTARGCLGRCNFCVDIGYEKSWRGREINDIVDEIEYITNTYNIKQFNFLDNNLADPGIEGKTRLISLMDKINERQLKIYFNCLARADSFCLEEDNLLINKMGRNGLFNILIGFESGYQEDLRLFNKKTKVSDNYKAYEMFEQHKVNVLPGFIMFHPYSCVEGLIANAEFLKNINKSYWFLAYCSSLKAFAGVEFVKKLKEDNLLSKDYSFKTTLNYRFVDNNIQGLAETLKNARLDSNTIKLAMGLEDAMNILARVNKNYVDWNKAEQFNNNIQDLSQEFGHYVHNYFMKSVEMVSLGWNETSYNELFNELESKAEKLNVTNIIKGFMKNNIANKELKHILYAKTIF